MKLSTYPGAPRQLAVAVLATTSPIILITNQHSMPRNWSSTLTPAE
ncbi:hypothetical protein [Rhodococcus jostii]